MVCPVRCRADVCGGGGHPTSKVAGSTSAQPETGQCMRLVLGITRHSIFHTDTAAPDCCETLRRLECDSDRSRYKCSVPHDLFRCTVVCMKPPPTLADVVQTEKRLICSADKSPKVYFALLSSTKNISWTSASSGVPQTRWSGGNSKHDHLAFSSSTLDFLVTSLEPSDTPHHKGAQLFPFPYAHTVDNTAIAHQEAHKGYRKAHLVEHSFPSSFLDISDIPSLPVDKRRDQRS